MTSSPVVDIKANMKEEEEEQLMLMRKSSTRRSIGNDIKSFSRYKGKPERRRIAINVDQEKFNRRSIGNVIKSFGLYITCYPNTLAAVNDSIHITNKFIVQRYEKYGRYDITIL